LFRPKSFRRVGMVQAFLSTMAAAAFCASCGGRTFQSTRARDTEGQVAVESKKKATSQPSQAADLTDSPRELTASKDEWPGRILAAASTSAPSHPKTYPELPARGQFGTLDYHCLQGSRCACANRVAVFRKLSQKDGAQLASEYERLTQQPLSRCYATEAISNQTTDNWIGAVRGAHTRCQYIRSQKPDAVTLDLIAGTYASPHQVHNIWSGSVGGITYDGMKDFYKDVPLNARIRRFWLIADVRVDGDHVPVELPLPSLFPALLETDEGYFEVGERIVPEPAYHCSQEAVLSGKIVDAVPCPFCLRRFLEDLEREVSVAFAQAPLSSERNHDPGVIPGEMWLRRRRQASNVLGGGMWEDTTYIVSIFSTAPPDVLKTLQDPFSIGRPIDKTDMTSVHARLTVSTTVAPHRMTDLYRDPNDDQMQKFANMSTAAFFAALGKACSRWGAMRENVCIFNFQYPPT